LPGAGAGWSAELASFDREHVWHPYAPLPDPQEHLPVVGAKGVRLQLADGRTLIDGMASWWCAIHGYRHPRLDRALAEQLGRMAHVMFGGLTHEGAVRLAARLIELAPDGLDRVFFADSGSVAIEVAIKLCLQYQQALSARGGRRRPGTQRTRLLTIRGGYHGDTTGAMALCDPVAGMHHLFRPLLPEHIFAPRPPAGFAAALQERWREQTDALFSRHGEEIAAVVVEPIVQGAGGMRFYAPAYLAHLRALCDRYGALLVVDEIATGFGRSGRLFACEHAGVSPDVMCVGKALTGGYLSLAALLCSEEVAAGLSAGEGGALMHGPTFMANPLACAVAGASLELIAAGDWRHDVARIERALARGLGGADAIEGVADVRVLGAIGVIELDREVDVARATRAAVQAGVWLRPFGNLIYAMPPYIIDEDDLAALCEGMLAAARACCAQSRAVA